MGRWAKIVGWGGMAILGWFVGQAQPFVSAQSIRGKPAPPSPPAPDPEKHIVAYVNGVPITRQELGEDLILRKGKDQIKLLINRRIIEQACQQAGITVTDGEVESDLKEAIKTTNTASPSQFEETVLKARRTTLYEYKEDVLRPGIAMRKLAGKRVEVNGDDLRKAFDAKYGDKVRCRVIVVPQQREAARIHTEVDDHPENFLRAAKQQPDPHLAAIGGLVKIHRHFGADMVEKVAFELRDGEVSHVFQIKDGWVLLLREALEPAERKKPEEVHEELSKEITEQKIRQVVPELFNELRQQSTVRDYLNNKFDIKEVMNEFHRKTPPGPAAAAAP